VPDKKPRNITSGTTNSAHRNSDILNCPGEANWLIGLSSFLRENP
jgi:hypothetical protein